MFKLHAVPRAPEVVRPTALQLVEYLAPAPGHQVLDIGCGRGAVALPLAAAVGEDGEVYGIDGDADAVAELTPLVRAAGLRNLVIRRMDVHDPTYAPHDFDGITGDMSIAALPDLPRALTNYRQLLKPGGKLAFSAPGHPLLRLREVAEVVELLHQAGFVDVVVHHAETRITAATSGDLVRWARGSGMPAVWNALSEARRRTAEQHLGAAVELPVSYFLATAPAGGGCPFS